MTFLFDEESVRSFFRAKDQDLDFNSAVNQLIVGVLGTGQYADDQSATDRDYVLIRKGFSKEASVEKYLPQIVDETAQHAKSWASAGEFDIFRAASKLVVSINIRCIFGDEFMRAHGAQVMRLYYEIERNGTAPLTVAFPNLPTPAVRRARLAREELKQLIGKVVEARRALPAPAEGAPRGHDYLQMWMDYESADGTRIDLAYLCRHLLGMLFAAHTNTAGTLAWTLLQIAARPDVTREVVDEQAALIARSGETITYATIKQLDALDRCIKESMRTHSTAMMVRRAARPFEVGKTVVPQGHMVCVSPIVMNTDPAIFAHPEEYRPERWTDEAMRKDLSSRNVWVQFGYGKHRCMGESFANVVLKTCCALLLREYALELRSPVPEPDWAKALGVPFGVGRTAVRLTPRQPAEPRGASYLPQLAHP